MTKRILVIKGGALGDFLLTLPLIAALRERFPAAFLELVTSPERSFLVEGLADRVHSIWRSEIASLYSPGGEFKLFLEKWLSTVDLLINVSEAEIYPRRYLKSGATFIHLPSFPPPGERIPVPDYLKREIERKGWKLTFRPGRITLNEDLIAAARDYLRGRAGADRPDRWVAIHPGSGSRQKNWPEENFAKTILWIKNRFSCRIAIIGGEAESNVTAGLQTRLPQDGIIFITGEDLKLVAGILKNSRLYLGNDSGITHLSALLGVPTIALFGPTDPMVWKPLGEQVEVISGKAVCSPCSPEIRRSCPENRCLKSISPAEVKEKIRTSHLLSGMSFPVPK